MSADTVAGGSHTVALTLVNAGVLASVDGNAPLFFPVKGRLSATSLAEALNMFDEDPTTILIIGTRADGEPGWDEVDQNELDELMAASPLMIHVISEAQALALDPNTREPAAWLIMGTSLDETEGLTYGSVRWWVQDEDGVVNRADVKYLGTNSGQIYPRAGAGSPSLMAGMVEAIISKHPHVRRVHVWSTDGQSGGDAYKLPSGSFWETLKLPQAYKEAGGDVVVLPDPAEMLVIASGNGISHKK